MKYLQRRKATEYQECGKQLRYFLGGTLPTERNGKATDDNGRWKKAEVQEYIERNFPSNQWSQALEAYKSVSSLNWKNPY